MSSLTSSHRTSLFAVLAFAGALSACSNTPPPENDPPLGTESASATSSAPVEAPKANPDLDKGRGFIEAGKFADAIAPLEKAVATHPKSAEAAYYLGLAYDQTGKKPEAEAKYKAAIALKPDLVEALQNLAAIYLEEPPRPDDAIPLLRAALKSDPTSARTLANMGYAFGLKKDVDKATTAYEASLKAEDAPAVRYAYGAMLLENGKQKEAVAQLAKAADATEDLATVASIARLMGKAEAFDQCVRLLDKVVAKKPDSAELLVRRGTCKHETKDEKGASDDFRGALKIDAKFQPAHYYLAMSLLAQKNKAEGKAELKKAYELDKESPVGKLAKKKLDELK
jgi:Flp pilus assembly protein TadD